MTPTEHTCWTMIHGAAEGNADDREYFVQRYGPVLRAYLESRWGGSPLAGEIGDTVQDVFVECFRQGGVLEKVRRIDHGGFRRFLYGVVRNFARRVETERKRSRERQAPADVDLDGFERREETLSKIFDRAWARSVLDEAVALMLHRADQRGEDARVRVEILHLRFHEDLPLREIAGRLNLDAEAIYTDYARARREFKAALYKVVQFHNPGSAADAKKEFEEILSLLA